MSPASISIHQHASCIKHIPIAGRDITNYIQLLLREREPTIPADDAMDVAKRIKEKYCYVCPDMAKEFRKYDEEPGKWIKQYQSVYRTRKWECDVAYERFLGPEIFFNPEICNPDWTTPVPQAPLTAAPMAPRVASPSTSGRPSRAAAATWRR